MLGHSAPGQNSCVADVPRPTRWVIPRDANYSPHNPHDPYTLDKEYSEGLIINPKTLTKDPGGNSGERG